jgi:hypothetical protein
MILQQRGEAGEERVIFYASRSNNKPESNYSSYAGKCLAAVWGVQYHRVYLYGRKFLLYTDHRPLEWLIVTVGQDIAARRLTMCVTLDEIRCSSARRVRKPRLAFQQT